MGELGDLQAKLRASEVAISDGSAELARARDELATSKEREASLERTARRAEWRAAEAEVSRDAMKEYGLHST